MSLKEPAWGKESDDWYHRDEIAQCEEWAKIFGATKNPRDLIEVTFKIGPIWEPIE